MMGPRQLSPALLAVALGAWLGPASVSAQGPACRGSDNASTEVIEVTPGDGAQNVALDAPVLVRYLRDVDLDALKAQVAEYVGDDAAEEAELIALLRVIPAERRDDPPTYEHVAGRVVRLDAHTVAFFADALLKRDTDYQALIATPDLDANPRETFDFTTGDHVDEDPPTFDVGGDDVRLSSDPLSENCSGEPGSFVVSLDFPHATDDADEGALEYLVFLTRARGLEAPELRARARNFGGSINMSIVLGPEEVREPVCIAIRVVDGVGRTADGQREICFDPIQTSHFEPMCSVGPVPGVPRPGGFLIPSVLACAALGLGRRRSSR